MPPFAENVPRGGFVPRMVLKAGDRDGEGASLKDLRDDVE